MRYCTEGGSSKSEEINMMNHKRTLFSALQLSVQPRDTLRKLMDKRISAIAWDYIQDEEGIYPIVRAMGEIAGNTAVIIAAEYLSQGGKGQGLIWEMYRCGSCRSGNYRSGNGSRICLSSSPGIGAL